MSWDLLLFWDSRCYFKNIWFKNQRPPAEITSAPSRGIFIPSTLLVVADLSVTFKQSEPHLNFVLQELKIAQ